MTLPLHTLYPHPHQPLDDWIRDGERLVRDWIVFASKWGHPVTGKIERRVVHSDDGTVVRIEWWEVAW